MAKPTWFWKVIQHWEEGEEGEREKKRNKRKKRRKEKRKTMENPTDAPVGKYCTCTRVWSLVCAGDAAAPVQRKQEAPLPSQLIIALSQCPHTCCAFY